jgi:hypothetical protein
MRFDKQRLRLLESVEAGDDTKRALLYLRLLGCHEGAWDHQGGLDPELMSDLIPRVPAAALAAALRAAPKDRYAASGAARWVIDERNWKKLDPKLVAEVLPALAACALAHPRPKSRRRTLMSLRALGGDQVLQPLRDAMAGTIARRPLPEAERPEPAGMIVGRGEPEAVRDIENERVVAAYFLAELGDRRSLPAMGVLLEEIDREEEKELLKRAISMLGKDQPGAER